MKTLIITLVIGLNVVLATGAAFAGGNERHEDRKYDHDEQYESKMYGTIQTLPNGTIGTWNVNGRDVTVTKTTIIKEKHGKAEVGAYVEVEGISSGNALTARKIEVKRAGR